MIVASDIKTTASVIPVYGDTVLIGYRTDTEDWTSPGGHLERGENPYEGVVREAWEEFGLKIDPDWNSLTLIEATDNSDGGKNYAFIAYMDTDEGKFENKGKKIEIVDPHWVTFQQLQRIAFKGELFTPFQVTAERLLGIELTPRARLMEEHEIFPSQEIAGPNLVMSDEDIEFVEDGGAGSGNWGHAGRLGIQGGSAASGSKSIVLSPLTIGTDTAEIAKGLQVAEGRMREDGDIPLSTIPQSQICRFAPGGDTVVANSLVDLGAPEIITGMTDEYKTHGGQLLSVMDGKTKVMVDKDSGEDNVNDAYLLTTSSESGKPVSHMVINTQATDGDSVYLLRPTNARNSVKHETAHLIFNDNLDITFRPEGSRPHTDSGLFRAHANASTLLGEYIQKYGQDRGEAKFFADFPILRSYAMTNADEFGAIAIQAVTSDSGKIDTHAIKFALPEAQSKYILQSLEEKRR
jgi:8-oxo-dGTP pyrophosphatase MutT (NUDIX family)